MAGGATARCKAAEVDGHLDDIANSPADDTFRDLHAMRQQANQIIDSSCCQLRYCYCIRSVLSASMQEASPR